jgi:hypothetical protein
MAARQFLNKIGVNAVKKSKSMNAEYIMISEKNITVELLIKILNASKLGA